MPGGGRFSLSLALAILSTSSTPAERGSTTIFRSVGLSAEHSTSLTLVPRGAAAAAALAAAATLVALAAASSCSEVAALCHAGGDLVCTSALCIQACDPNPAGSCLSNAAFAAAFLRAARSSASASLARPARSFAAALGAAGAGAAAEVPRSVRSRSSTSSLSVESRLSSMDAARCKAPRWRTSRWGYKTGTAKS